LHLPPWVRPTAKTEVDKYTLLCRTLVATPTNELVGSAGI